MKTKSLFITIGIALALISATSIGFYVGQTQSITSSEIKNVLSQNKNQQEVEKEKPLEKYTFSSLREQEFTPTKVEIESLIAQEDSFASYRVIFDTTLGKMSGQLNVPNNSSLESKPVVVMLRGYVPSEIYTTGIGTRKVAHMLANAGYTTIAPDFLGYGISDPEPENSWESRFVKPVQVIELLSGIETYGLPTTIENESTNTFDSIGIWAHSNGGQIALSVLEITGKEYPTSLWAPVTAPFPYSVLFFGDELADEGKEQRAWIALLEKDYDVFEFSVTQHIDSLHAPMQIQHGTADDAALISWSDAFVERIKQENIDRENQDEESQTSLSELVGDLTETTKSPIIYEYYRYPNVDHNLSQVWSTAVERDLLFYQEHLL